MSYEQMIAPGTLDAWEEIARRDDWHRRLVGSDIRMLIGDLRRARHALASQHRNAAPDGWQLVPIEPTEAMIGAGRDAYMLLPMGTHDPELFGGIYRAMLSAAPALTNSKMEDRRG